MQSNLVDSQLCLTPLLLLLESHPDPESRALPLKVYQGTSLQELPFVLDSNQAERIAVDQVVKSTPTGGVTTFELQCSSMVASLRNLKDRVAVLLDDTQTTPTAQARRLMAKIANQLDAVDSPDFAGRHAQEMGDAVVVSSLASMTMLLDSANDTALKVARQHSSTKGTGMSVGRMSAMAGMDYLDSY